MRIRTVKPEFWSHPIMGRLDDRTRLIALALLNHADDHGYFHADAAIVRGACAPFREDLATIREDLAKLVEVGWIDMGRHPEHGVIGWVIGWKDHQKVDHPKDSKIAGKCDTSRFIRSSRNPRDNVATTRDNLALYQGSGIRDQGREQGANSAAVATLPDDAFAKADQSASPKRQHTLGDLEACHATLVIFRDDRETAETLLALYGWEACNRGVAHLTPAAKARPHGKQRVTISELRTWLSASFDLEPEDYQRAGLSAPNAKAAK